MKKKIPLILGAVFIAAALFFALYPCVSNAINSICASSTIGGYNTEVEGLSAADKAKYLAAAEDYNRNLRELIDGFTYSSESVSDDYDDILNFGDGLIGYIEIDKIDVKLPIYHGDTEDVLTKGAAHIPNTALPTGGIGNHTVLSAHTGYPTQVFFDNLEDLSEGDLIEITVLDDILTYKVTAKNIVDPDDISLLGVDENKDLLSLITCYPYGINSHRLIITAERTTTATADETAQSNSTESTNTNGSFEIIIIVASAIILTVAAVLILCKIRKRRREPWKSENSTE